MMKRRILLWGLLVVALAMAAWGVARYLDSRPNPILVTEMPATAAGPSIVEVEVARARPIPMGVSDKSMLGVPGSVTLYVPTADLDAVAAEERELRGALGVWLAVPGRGLQLEQAWSNTEVDDGFFLASQRARVVLHARLVPVPAAGK
jgi:hypothetical protein